MLSQIFLSWYLRLWQHPQPHIFIDVRQGRNWNLSNQSKQSGFISHSLCRVTWYSQLGQRTQCLISWLTLHLTSGASPKTQPLQMLRQWDSDIVSQSWEQQAKIKTNPQMDFSNEKNHYNHNQILNCYTQNTHRVLSRIKILMESGESARNYSYTGHFLDNVCRIEKYEMYMTYNIYLCNWYMVFISKKKKL
jgi:hypothetical protein